MERVLYSEVNGYYAPKRYALAQALKQMLYWAIAQGESARHFKIETLDHRVIVEVDDELGEYIDPEYAALVKAYAKYWLSEHRAELESHLMLLRSADELERRRAEMELSKYYEQETAAGEAAEQAGNLPSAARHYSLALDNLEWEIASLEYERQSLSEATSTQKKQRAEYAKALAAKLSDLTGNTVSVQRKQFSPEAFCNKIREWAEAVIAAAPEDVPVKRELTESVEGTILTNDREAAEAAMFFLLDLLGEDEFVGYDTTDDGYTVYFGTNLSADTFAKIRDYVTTHGLNATFAA